MGSVFEPIRFVLDCQICLTTCFRLSNVFDVTFFSATIDGRNLIFGHKLHIGTPYRGKHFWTHQIPTSCLPTLLIFIHIEHICSFFSATIDGRELIFGHKLHIGTPYRGKHFWTHQIPTSCLPTLLIFIHIEHICSFFSATIDGRELIFGHKLYIGTPYRGKHFWTHQIPTSCLPTLLIFIHIEHICSFFSATIDGRELIFGHKLYIGTPYRGKHFWTHQIPTSCLPTLLIFIHIEHICSFFSATIDGRELIFGHKLYIGTPYRGKRFWTHQIPTSCLPTLLIFIHIEHICSFFIAFF